jgi:hypothetical protein
MDTSDAYITINPGVIITARQRTRIMQIAPYFKTAFVISHVTSGIRTQESQLRIIAQFAISEGITSPEFRQHIRRGTPVDYQSNGQYWWQETWSMELNLGFIVNPPIACMCLAHSFRPDGTDRMRCIIPASPHLNPEGTCVDMSGISINNIIARLLEAKTDPLCAIRAITVERKQNCVHVDFLPPYKDA